MAEVTQPTTQPAPTAQASTPTPAAPARPTVLAQAAQAPAARTDAQLVALFDYWQAEQAAGRMTRDQARAQAQSLSPEDQQRLRAAVTARNEAAAQRSAEALAEAERSAAEATRAREAAQEELRRANERARRILGNGATPSPGSSPSNGGSSSRSGGSAPSGGTSPSRGGAPRSRIISDEPVSYNGGAPGIDIDIAGLTTSATYNPTNLPVDLAAVVSRLPKRALQMA